jgi:anti-anti-sigma factor
MTIDIRIRDDVARITLTGRFDFEVHRVFKNAYLPLLDKPAVREIEVEMSKVSYMDSAALGMLMLLHDRAKETHKRVTLLNPSTEAEQVMDIANFRKIFTFKTGY